ncbi:MAG: YqjF family protein [Desulfobulbaceae bacterium]
MRSVFLTAELRHLVMISYQAEPEILAPLVPKGTELDDWHGKTLLSLVAFSFEGIRLKGVPIPFYRNFAEINLRLYVRGKAPDGWRRGVVFVREVVPRRAIAFVARWLYNENFVTCPTRSRLDHDPGSGHRSALYSWKYREEWLSVGAEYAGEPVSPGTGSAEEFIVGHYWGYATRRDGSTVAYRIEHPTWKVWHAALFSTKGDLAGFYGAQFGSVFARQPSSVLVAEGSPVVVHPAAALRP